jgi:hypothetical protein
MFLQDQIKGLSKTNLTSQAALTGATLANPCHDIEPTKLKKEAHQSL